MISKEIVIEIIKCIASYNDPLKKEKTFIDLIISDELDSVNYYDNQFKLLSITKHDYDHQHYKIDNDIFDIFIYQGQEINKFNLYQMIICDNYTEIYNFKQDEYSNKIKVCSFKIPTSIFTFFDNSIIIIKNGINSDCKYETISIQNNP